MNKDGWRYCQFCTPNNEEDYDPQYDDVALVYDEINNIWYCQSCGYEEPN